MDRLDIAYDHEDQATRKEGYLFSWLFQNHDEQLFEYFRMAVFAWINKQDDAARLAAYTAAIIAVSKERHAMTGLLRVIAYDARIDVEGSLISMADWIASRDNYGFLEQGRCRKELHKTDGVYSRAIFPPDPKVFIRRYPDLLTSHPVRPPFDGIAFWENRIHTVSEWLTLSGAERHQAGEAFLKRECPNNYPDYDSDVFVWFEFAITKEVRTAIAEGRAESDLGVTALVAMLHLAEAIRTNALRKFMGL